MAQFQGNKEYNTFVKGIITEGNPLSFPENASIDEANFELKRNGQRVRRFGMDWQNQTSPTIISGPTVDIGADVISSAVWKTEGTNGELSILVVQIADELFFYDANSDDIMSAPLNQGLSINIGGNPSEEADFTTIFGSLVVSNNQKGVHYLTYDIDTDTVSAEVRNILVRDIWGIDDGLAVSKRPANLSDLHEYNIVNQGWGERQYFDGTLQDLYYKDFKNYSPHVYPSNTDIVSSGKNPANGDTFDGALIFRLLLGNTPAPKGFFIIDAFRRGASRRVLLTSDKRFGVKSSNSTFTLSSFLVDGSEWHPNKRINVSVDLPTDETEGGIKSVASYAGRVWFTGAGSKVTDGDDRSPNLGSYVFFSQIVDSEENIGKCYQDGNPTSEEFPDILDTDGGAIKIPGMYSPFKILTTARSVIVFADNGVWEISGGETNFTATNFEIRKVTNVKPISPNSIVEAEGQIFYWAEEGIYVLQPDQITGNMASANITENTILTLYNEIPTDDKKSAIGAFDSVSRQVRWLYNGANIEGASSITLTVTRFSWDTDGISYDSNTDFVSPQDTAMREVFFKTDGTVMYALGDSSDTVYQYTLSTAWDLSTSSYASISFALPVSTAPGGLFFKTDGTKMYHSDTGTNTVYQYALSTAWNVSTAVSETTFNSSSELQGGPTQLFIDSSGFRMYLIGRAASGVNDYTIFQYSLSTAWDVGTATYTGNSFNLENNVFNTGVFLSMFFRSNGKELLVIESSTNDTLYRIDLGTAWDLSTANYTSGDSFSLNSQDGFHNGLYVRPDEDKFFTITGNTDSVFRYSFSGEEVVEETIDATNVLSFFNKELVLDLVLNSFYKFELADGADYYPVDYIITNDVSDSEVEDIVENSSGQIVTNSSSENVVITRILRVIGNTTVKFLTSNILAEYGVSEYNNTSFEDFGNDASAYLVTGYETLQSPIVQKQAPYIVAHFEQTETSVDASGNVTTPSSCILQTQWDFADSAASNKFGPNQQIYRLPRNYLAPSGGGSIDYGKSVITTKTKMRGRGRALSLKFSTEAGKDLRMYGWGVKYTGVENV